MKNLIQKSIVPLFILLNVILLIVYLCQATRNVVFMDYWRLAEKYIPLIEEGEFHVSDLWVAYWGQRNPLMFGTLCFNIKFFDFNAMIEIIAGAIMIGIVAWLYYYIMKKRINIKWNLKNRVAFFFPAILGFFCLNQWEIMETQFSFSFYVRIFVYICVFFIADKALFDVSKRRGMLCASILAMFAICAMSQLYFGGLVLAGYVGLIVAFIVYPRNRKRYLYYTMQWTIFNGLGVFMYMYNMDSSSAGGNFIAFFESIFDGSFFIALFYLLDASVMQTKIMQVQDTKTIVLIGIILLAAIAVCVVLFFKTKMYEQTFIPIFLVAYGMFSVAAIMYGRMFEYGLPFLASSRYVVETTMIWTGCIGILAYTWATSKSKLVICMLIFLTSSYLYCNYDVYMQKDFKGFYKENIAYMCTQIENYSDEELIVMQANSPDMVRNVCKMLQEYKLNIFAK